SDVCSSDLVRKPIRSALMHAPDPPERVKRNHVRNVERALDLRRRQAGHPEVGVQQIVPAATARPPYEPRERLHVRQQVFLRYRLRRAGGNMKDTRARVPRDDLGLLRVVAPSEHVDLYASICQAPREVSDVDVLSAGIRAAERREGRRMIADHRYPKHWQNASLPL